MATWRTIANGEIDLDSPVTQQLLSALRDNPVAVTEGASGAPRVQDAALHTTVTTAGRNWVANRMEVSTVAARTVSIGAGGVGSYAMLRATATSVSYSAGNSVAGSALRYSDASGRYTAQTPTGTWRCLGNIQGNGAGTGAAPECTTVFLRIS